LTDFKNNYLVFKLNN